MEVERTQSGILYWRDASFWQLEITADHETTGVDAKAFGAAILRFGQGRKRPLLIYRAPASLPSFEALEHFADVAPALLSGVAYWVVSTQAAATSELVRSVFLSSLPVQVFTTENDAVAWCQNLLALEVRRPSA